MRSYDTPEVRAIAPHGIYKSTLFFFAQLPVVSKSIINKFYALILYYLIIHDF